MFSKKSVVHFRVLSRTKHNVLWVFLRCLSTHRAFVMMDPLVDPAEFCWLTLFNIFSGIKTLFYFSYPRPPQPVCNLLTLSRDRTKLWHVADITIMLFNHHATTYSTPYTICYLYVIYYIGSNYLIHMATNGQ